ncbi:HAD family hydrolase [Paludisphaera borealis]|uniref:Alpha-D-glucose 1-phosphate phosphatase YihX n=1 Tax=Paludisphaera borealis TaxID=1387353 RepID=A0A1U7CN25_9BACT|nr:HAD family phosphatase [Paludisphaera borealis]APW60321.1 Alpha-D-glucose 1-phosphate phosphatase YihX [Paludisphaera borealis]
MRLPVLMFDFGNVIGFFDYMLIFGRFGARLGLSADEFRTLVEAKGMSRLLAEFERGALAPEEFSRRIQAEVGLNIPFEEFAADWEDIFELNTSVGELVADLKRQGYTLVLGSNTNGIHAPFFRRQFRETLDHFDHLVYSHEARFLKPDRGFFDACVEAAGVSAGSCVFIDDLEANVEGARAAGLQGVVYRGDTSKLIEDLRAIGVELLGDVR